MSDSLARFTFVGPFRYNAEQAQAVPNTHVTGITTLLPSFTNPWPRPLQSSRCTPLPLSKPSSPTPAPLEASVHPSTATATSQLQVPPPQVSPSKRWTTGFTQTFSAGVAAVKSGLNWTGGISDKQQGNRDSVRSEGGCEPSGPIFGFPLVDVTPMVVPKHFLISDPPLEKCGCEDCQQYEKQLEESVTGAVLPLYELDAEAVHADVAAGDYDGLAPNTLGREDSAQAVAPNSPVTAPQIRRFNQGDRIAELQAEIAKNDRIIYLQDRIISLLQNGADTGDENTTHTTQATLPNTSVRQGTHGPIAASPQRNHSTHGRPSEEGSRPSTATADTIATAASNEVAADHRLAMHRGSVMEPGVALDRTIVAGIGIVQKGRGVELWRIR